jgi:hypothetical protein
MSEIDRETQTNPEETSTVSSDEWTAKTAEREYYHRGGFFIKRSLRPSEYMTTVIHYREKPLHAKYKVPTGEPYNYSYIGIEHLHNM